MDNEVIIRIYSKWNHCSQIVAGFLMLEYVCGGGYNRKD